jgi:hypothetical protein
MKRNQRLIVQNAEQAGNCRNVRQSTRTNSVRLRLSVVFALVPCLTSTLLCADEGQSEFESKIAPIFQAHCVTCHNDIDKKGDFSLETRKSFLAGDFVDAKNPSQSHLLEVLAVGKNGKAEMPKGKPPLSLAERNTIAEWIKAGAGWPAKIKITEAVVSNLDWWSLQPHRRPRVPMIADEWIRNPIDAFVLAKLNDKKLKPSAVADRRNLIRRLYFDLIGLPPHPDVVDRFVEDRDPFAYEQLVDRLLASPQYGERWARHWLDVVKYADTCGYDKDKLRPNAWPYRDYVIRSFNEDKPYTRFVKEQIAGDVFFPGTADGILGLGFIAAGPWDFIGHVEVPETKIDGRIARHIDRDEMVTNTLNTFCSATIQCARCHNHKFDPFTQTHYYSLQAVFAAVDRANRPYNSDPQVESQRKKLSEQIAAAEVELKEMDADIQLAGGAKLAELNKRIAELKPKVEVKGKRPEYGYHSNITAKNTEIKWVQVDLGQPTDVSRIVIRPCHDEFQNIGAGFGFPIQFRVEAANSVADFSNPQKSKTLLDQTSDLANPGLAPVEIVTDKLKARFIRVTATKLVVRSNDYMLALSELEAYDASGKNVALKKLVTAKDSIEAPVRWAKKNLTDGIFPTSADPVAVAQLAAFNKERQELVAKFNTPERMKRRADLTKQLADARKNRRELPPGRMVYAAATHFKPQSGFQPTKGRPRRVQVLHRGNILQPREDVQPGTLPIFAHENFEFDLPSEHRESDRRKALANWITRKDHPLTWRSIVNRIWQYHFGRGIVDSPNDLGRMGKLPTHPELLDWLATEFRDNGQSYKRLHRLIVTSATYRQSSAHDEQKSLKDGSNQFLWRMNRRRLEAEEVRDSILSVSGRLRTKMEGPGFYLFVLEKTAHSPHYEYHKFDPSDQMSHRRSVYRFIARSQPDPFMTTLDCADSSQSTPQRNETLTSLQALSLLNNKFNLVMAESFAERLKSSEKELTNQVELAFRLVTGRRPSNSEKAALVKYATQHGLANLSRVMFNLSELVFVD